ncbi:conserved hypothetical protein [Tenacibaculum sp. 190524A05c]|uniref:hypothetical protein n=1 Tax=Tenacibaculum platacis TaxID=3137852 RepID=UPI0031FB7D8D
MKKSIFLILIFFSINLVSQDFEVIKSKEFKDEKKIFGGISYLTYDNNGGVFAIRRHKKGYYISHFNNSLKLNSQYNLQTKGEIEAAYVSENKLKLIDYQYNRKEKRGVYKVFSSNLDSLKFSSKEFFSISKDQMKKYGEIKGAYGQVFDNLFKKGIQKKDQKYFNKFLYSKGKKYFALSFDVDKKENDAHHFYVFDSEFNLVYDKLILKEIKDELFVYQDQIIDKNSNLFCIAKVYDENNLKSKDDFYFNLSKVSKEKEIQSVDFKHPGKFIESLSIIRENNFITCIGFYKNEKDSYYDGVFIVKVDPVTLNIIHKVFNPFSEEFLNNKFNNGKKRKKKKEKIKNLKIKNIKLRENQELLIEAEEDYVIVSRNSKGTNRYYRHFHDIISFKIDESGSLIKVKNLKKRQGAAHRSSAVLNCSFTSLHKDDYHFYFVNTSDKIEANKKSIFIPGRSYKKTDLYVVYYKDNGDFKHQKLIDNNESKVYFDMSRGISVDEKNTVILFGRKNKKYQLVKIRIK